MLYWFKDLGLCSKFYNVLAIKKDPSSLIELILLLQIDHRQERCTQ